MFVCRGVRLAKKKKKDTGFISGMNGCAENGIGSTPADEMLTPSFLWQRLILLRHPTQPAVLARFDRNNTASVGRHKFLETSEFCCTPWRLLGIIV